MTDSLFWGWTCPSFWPRLEKLPFTSLNTLLEFWWWWVCSVIWLLWWFHGCMGISEFIRLCAVNMCRLLIKINNLINNLIKDPAVHRSTKKADKCLPDTHSYTVGSSQGSSLFHQGTSQSAHLLWFCLTFHIYVSIYDKEWYLEALCRCCQSFGTIVLKDLQNGILGRDPVGPSDRDQKNVFDEKEERKHLDKFIKLYVSCNND